MSRFLIEHAGRAAAGVKGTSNDKEIVRVLDLFDMLIMPGDESVSPHLKSTGFWESWITEWVRTHVDSDTLFIDVGANTGYYSFYAHSLGAKVLAVEANPSYATMIVESRQVNGMHFSVCPIAVSDHAGHVTLSIPDHLHGSASTVLDFVGSQWGGTNIEVQSLTLDMLLHVVPHKTKTVIKIDAEGAEEKIWDGMCNTLVDRRPIVMLEWTPNAYTDRFYDNVFIYGDIFFINHDGGETPVDKDWLDTQTDWAMLAIHPR